MTQQEQQQIIDHLAALANQLQAARPGFDQQYDVDVMLPTLVQRCADWMNHYKKLIDLGNFAQVFDQVAAETNAFKERRPEMPWPNEPSLRGLTCKAHLATKLTRDFLARFMQPAARQEYDAQGNKIVSMARRFEERLAWIKQYGDDGPVDEPVQPQATAPKKVEDARIVAIREQIDQECKQHGYTRYQQAKHARLTRRLDDLLANPSRQIYFDRARGGIEQITGVAAIERIMQEELRSADNPIR